MGSLLLSGCVYSHHTAVVPAPTATTTTRTVVVREAPPAPRTEVIGVAPSEDHAWVPGYWTYSDNRWVWMPGHWERRPSTGATWVPGHWDKNADERGWVWTPGHWE